MKLYKSFFWCLIFISSPFLSSGQTPAHYVDTMIGTDLKGFESGYCVPGATRPFGMLQFTTPIVNKEVGFVVNQVNAGCGHMGNFPMLAFKGELHSSPERMMGGKVRISDEQAGGAFPRWSILKN